MSRETLYKRFETREGYAYKPIDTYYGNPKGKKMVYLDDAVVMVEKQRTRTFNGVEYINKLDVLLNLNEIKRTAPKENRSNFGLSWELEELKNE